MADTSSTGSQSAKKDNWIDHVTLEPFDKLKLTEGSRAKVGIVNKSPRRISYKVKTTRYYSVMPNRTYGMIDPFGSACIRIAFKPRKNERPFGKNDRITVLLKAVPEANSKARRRVLRLVNGPKEEPVPKPRSIVSKKKKPSHQLLHYYGGKSRVKASQLPSKTPRMVQHAVQG